MLGSNEEGLFKPEIVLQWSSVNDGLIITFEIYILAFYLYFINL